MSIQANLEAIQKQLPPQVQLIAVSKTKPVEQLHEAYLAGQREFGENKVQEMVDKHDLLPKDIHWHLIGHLQTNKVKFIAPFVSLIHAVDSLKLLSEIDKQAKKNERVIDCLLQFHVAEEDTKFGLSIDEATELLSSESYRMMENIRIVGIMGMATFTEDNNQIRREFKHLQTIFHDLKNTFFNTSNHFKEISMGMSGDYLLAIEEGSTMVRVGSAIFGTR